jgi:hypothetical protein
MGLSRLRAHSLKTRPNPLLAIVTLGIANYRSAVNMLMSIMYVYKLKKKKKKRYRVLCLLRLAWI